MCLEDTVAYEYQRTDVREVNICRLKLVRLNSCTSFKGFFHGDIMFLNLPAADTVGMNLLHFPSDVRPTSGPHFILVKPPTSDRIDPLPALMCSDDKNVAYCAAMLCSSYFVRQDSERGRPLQT